MGQPVATTSIKTATTATTTTGTMSTRATGATTTSGHGVKREPGDGVPNAVIYKNSNHSLVFYIHVFDDRIVCSRIYDSVDSLFVRHFVHRFDFRLDHLFYDTGNSDVVFDNSSDFDNRTRFNDDGFYNIVCDNV
ncbi:unnamed protein product [Zymoseptoria tritici ST99CH_1A5]|uniref:Uncharacterized protein n=2 Tax=Zymoseptoria tritici TaxID=1047171 RepID=A0A2H1FZD4_ZYMTR|nr:unnamed protein product [Zymoseptoria tritici ST99CH_1E4]SMR47919.1 unnamed protein product [Zymoseptoria tritici ST99CH_3D1]SMY21825.1 unnamed protein product [Zymoseptoria tritici ST99CH_1A5]